MSSIEKALRWVVLAGVFALPLIVLSAPYKILGPFDSSNLFFPFIAGKNLMFRVLVEVITGAWLALALVMPQYRPKRNWILGALALFVLVIAIADAQGVNPFKSFWSNYERMDGWVTLAHLLAYTVVVACVLNTENLWRKLFNWSLIVSVFLSVWGFLQVVGIITLGQGGSAGLEARVDATFGNPIYLAAYMLFHIFIAALLLSWTWKERRGGAGMPPSAVFYPIAIVLDTLALFFSGSRGAILGLIGGALLALFLYALSRDASARLRRATIAVFAIALVLGVSLRLARDTSVVQSVGFLQRLGSISLSENDIKARLINVSIAWQGIKEKPVLGWGQENYAIVFDKYYDPRMYGQEQWFDRVHDVIFDWWIAGGTLGLLAYLSIFAAVVWTLWRRHDAFSSAERSILLGLLAGYFIHNLTVFDNITSYLLFGTILGFILYRASDGERVLFRKHLVPEGSLPLVAALSTVLVLASAWWVNAAALSENQTLLTALQPQSGGPTQNLTLFEKAIGYGTYGTQEAREQLAQITLQLAGSQVSTDIKSQFLNAAVKQLDAQSKISPLDARFPLFAGAALQAYGDYADAWQEFTRAHTLSPKKQTILFAMVQNRLSVGDAAQAVSLAQQAYELDTDYNDALGFYASALISTGQESKAMQVLAPAIKTGAAANTQVAEAFVARKEYGPIVSIWKAAVAAQPQNAQLYMTLAGAYFAQGDSGDAIAVLEQLAAAIPAQASQAQQLISGIRSGTVK